MTILQQRVWFLGRDTGLLASSKSRAALRVQHWLSGASAPEIPAQYCPVHHRVPALGRLHKNTRLTSRGFEVGLGIPDRRQGPRPVPKLLSGSTLDLSPGGH